MPRAMPSPVKWPPSSGPRCVIAIVIASNRSRSTEGDRGSLSATPQIPHMFDSDPHVPQLQSKRDIKRRSHPCWVVILVENNTYPEDVRVRDEAETLVAAGYRVTVVAPRGERQPRTERIRGVEVVRFWLPATPQSMPGFVTEYLVGHAALAWHALRMLVRGADVLQVCNPPDTLAVLLIVARIFGRRTVFDNHDMFAELFEVRYGSRRVVAALRVSQRVAWRCPDLVLTTNDSQREAVLGAVDRSPGSVVVVRNGPRAAAAGDAIGTVGADRRRHAVELVFVGALEPQDGVVTLAQVLQLLEQRHRLSVRLTVVGAGSCQPLLARECRQRGVGDRVKFTGWIPHDEVAMALARADICVDPAPCNELNHTSTMIKIAEYLAAGKPIVAFELRETRRTARNAALYAASGDTEQFASLVARIATDPPLAEQLAAQARLRSPELLWKHSAERLLDAYALLAGGGDYRAAGDRREDRQWR